MNPALLSAEFRDLFPGGVAAAELRVSGDAALLLPAEAACLGRAVQQRIEDFAGGRLCARRALAELGVQNFALRVGHDRQPVWPDSMVGSITHTDGLCAAVAAERRLFAGLGVDSEVAGDVQPDIWASICTAREIDWLHSLPAAEQARAATLIFAAKEAFYKCQYRITAEFLGFHDVMIDAPDWGGREGAFAVHAQRAVAIADFAAFPLLGRYRCHEQFVSAGMALPARGV